MVLKQEPSCRVLPCILTEDIVGGQVVIVANLAPRKMRGIESNGMILMAEDAGGRLHFINPEQDINPGAGVLNENIFICPCKCRGFLPGLHS